MLPSFQRHVEDIGATSPNEALGLLESDDNLWSSLLGAVKDFRSHQASSSLCILAVYQALVATRERRGASLLELMRLYLMSENLSQEPIIKQLHSEILKISYEQRCKLVTSWKDTLDRNTSIATFGDSEIAKNLEALAESFESMDESFKKNADFAFEGFFNSVMNLLSRPPRSFAFHEIFYFSNIKLLRKSLTPQPSLCLKVALQNPEYFLKCKCCTGKEAIQHPSLEDINILFKLYSESGAACDLYQIFEAFQSIIVKEKPKPKIEAVQ
ncbi:hypothetical protein BC829DRAFT_199245 [Chytridium lagenaria]|nr:hypothetical protein BC829DRAFT_199245 [Chytridium lagenaria]